MKGLLICVAIACNFIVIHTDTAKSSEETPRIRAGKSMTMKCFKGEMQLYASRKGLHQQHEPVRWICLKYIWFFSVRSRAKPSYRMPQHIRSFPTGIRSLPARSFTWQQHWCWPNWSAFQSASTFPSSSSTASPRKVNYSTRNGRKWKCTWNILFDKC